MSCKILIIDDEEQDRKGMSIVLKKAGYDDITFAVRGQEGAQKTEEINPDIAIIDVVLPDQDGFETCINIKALKDTQTKILMITGHLDAINAKKARVSGADEIVEKQPGHSNIVQALESLLQR